MESLRLGYIQITDAELEQLDSLVKLKQLSLKQAIVSDVALARLLPALSNLEILGLVEATQVTDALIPTIARVLPRLKAVDLIDTHVSAKGYATLDEIKKKMSLNVQITWDEPNDDAARRVLNAGVVVDVRIAGSATDLAVSKLNEPPAEFFEITGANLAGVRTALDVLPQVTTGRLHELASLDLSHTPITDAGLEKLEPLTRLRAWSSTAHPSSGRDSSICKGSRTSQNCGFAVRICQRRSSTILHVSNYSSTSL